MSFRESSISSTPRGACWTPDLPMALRDPVRKGETGSWASWGSIPPAPRPRGQSKAHRPHEALGCRRGEVNYRTVARDNAIV